MFTDIYHIWQEKLEIGMTDRSLLKKFGWTKKEMLKILHRQKFRQNLKELAEARDFRCASILEACREEMDRLSPEPEQGWLSFLFADGKYVLYPDNFPNVMEPAYERGKLFYMEVLRISVETEQECLGFSPELHFQLANEQETEKSIYKNEYEQFLRFCKNTYFLEFMRIASEITSFNTLGHIAGVHFVAMYMARQLHTCHAKVDLGLMSAAAIGHDIGKFGCKDSESRRVPYLHYYYTDQCLQRNNMPGISYIAANHSTWDLELENLSMESLLLIYADFRVKSTRDQDGEKIHFYTLKDSFDVILGKLDNVDQAKEKRYRRVYGKLVDFENYMVSLGIHTDFAETIPEKVTVKDTALLAGNEVIDAYKHYAIRHNVELMHILNHETLFANILEAARSEKDWKHTRTYLNIFREYCTYMNQHQKLMTINFLFELLMHREGDIRSAAGILMGNLIAHYDREYRKEIPDGMLPFFQESSSKDVFEKYLNMILNPDYRVTEQHKKWLGYKMETLVSSVLSNARSARKRDYMDVIVQEYRNTGRDEFTAFCMIRALLSIPAGECREDDLEIFMQFILTFSGRGNLELEVSILDYISRLLETSDHFAVIYAYGQQLMEQIPNRSLISIRYLKKKIGLALHLSPETWGETEGADIMDDEASIGQVFLENLKTATPWICKMVNIEYLNNQLKIGKNRQPVHTTTHLVNLLTGSECTDVRHLAGETLIQCSQYISHESCNEVAMELLKSLELGENEFSKNIPNYLGRLILSLQPEELEEIILVLDHMLVNENDPVACVTLDTIGVLIQHYPEYIRKNPQEEEENHIRRINHLLGLLLRGMASDHNVVAQESCFVLGEYVFGNKRISLDDKFLFYRFLAKKGIHILRDQKEDPLSFLIDAASMNHIYRFISDYLLENGKLMLEESEKVAFFPGTFDPFSLSHKGIVEEIRKKGFEVYLAIDEFSWSKKTQPRLIRRKIAAMSTASDNGVFMFPDDIPVNIANCEDLGNLRKLFPGKDVYIVAGSDVTAHASAYKKSPEENSIHTFDHIIFRRRGAEYSSEGGSSEESGVIQGNVVTLSLPVYLEDISSTRIRENIDLNRDISNLIDPMAQKYIYENNLYLREPQYKPILFTRSINCDVLEQVPEELWEELTRTVWKKKNAESIVRNLKQEGLSLALLRDEERGGVPVAVAAAKEIANSDLLEEFRDLEMTKNIREQARGKILLIKAIYAPEDSPLHDYFQIVLTELLAHYLAREYTCCLYHSFSYMEERRNQVDKTLIRQGFLRLTKEGEPETVMVVDMHKPYILIKNIETVIKEPFNTNKAVREVMEKAHKKLQIAITKFKPGTLVLSFDSSIMHHRLVQKIAEINQVPNKIIRPRKLGEKMCVPFGKVLRGSVTPNTVTKALHTEKVFNANMRGFSIMEYPNYSPLSTQLRTIHSFNQEVILVDDLLHKGYRLQELEPMLREHHIAISRILTGIMTANGRDLVSQYNLTPDYAYFIPNLSSWFVESTLYPFIGGDSVRSGGSNSAGLLTSVNLILPYVAPEFLILDNMEATYNLSAVCLQNAKDIMRVLEREYQKLFERNLTLNRLSEVILSPTCPDKGLFMTYNENFQASVYIENDIQRLIRLQGIVGKSGYLCID
ncbi:MAG: hypothetical protein PUB22_07795 [Clostridiales bacterium]|nr:hypothetical protein [Clostridiales bacterium]